MGSERNEAGRRDGKRDASGPRTRETRLEGGRKREMPANKERARERKEGDKNEDYCCASCAQSRAAMPESVCKCILSVVQIFKESHSRTTNHALPARG